MTHMINIINSIYMSDTLFHSDDQIISLTDGEHKIYIRKHLLMQKTLYFKHVFTVPIHDTIVELLLHD